MSTYSVKINVGTVTPSISQVYYGEDYYFNNYARLYVGDSFTVSTSKLSGTITFAAGFRYKSAVLSGFTETSASAGTDTVYGMTGTLTADHIGEHYGTMAVAKKPGAMATGGKFSYTVFGKYKATLNFNGMGGSNVPSPITQTQESSSQTAPDITFTIPTTKPTLDGFVCVGWAKSASTTPEYYPGGTITIPSSLSGATTTLYAVWHTEWHARLRYDANGGSGQPSDWHTTSIAYKQPSDVSTTVSLTTPTRQWYTFKGWDETKYATEFPEWQPGDTIKIPYVNTNRISRTIYASWYANWYSNLAYDANGGSGAPPIDKEVYVTFLEPHYHTHVISNIIPTHPDPEKIFKGWASSSTATSPEYKPGDKINVPYVLGDTANTTIYAVWVERRAIMKVKVDGEWKDADVYVNQGGTWNQPEKVYGKLDGEWKEGA